MCLWGTTRYKLPCVIQGSNFACHLSIIFLISPSAALHMPIGWFLAPGNWLVYPHVPWGWASLDPSIHHDKDTEDQHILYVHVETQTGNIHIRNASTDQNLQYLSTM